MHHQAFLLSILYSSNLGKYQKLLAVTEFWTLNHLFDRRPTLIQPPTGFSFNWACPTALKKNTKHSSPIISPLCWSFNVSDLDLWGLIRRREVKKRADWPQKENKHPIFFFIYSINHVVSSCPCPIFLSRRMRQFCGCFTAGDGVVARRAGEETSGLKVLHVPINPPHLSANDLNKIENASS